MDNLNKDEEIEKLRDKVTKYRKEMKRWKRKAIAYKMMLERYLDEQHRIDTTCE